MSIDLDVSALCIDPEIDLSLSGLAVLFPGGLKIEASLPNVDVAIASDWAKALLGQINAALLPLGPLFSILDIVLLIFQLLQAIPDAITGLDPSGIIELIPKIKVKVDAVLSIVPILSFPIMIKGILKVILVFIIGLKMQLQAIVSALLKADLGDARALELQGISIEAAVQLKAAVSCARVTADATINGIAQGMGPIGTLMGLLSVFIQVSGLPIELPSLSNIGAGSAASINAQLDALDVFTDVVGKIIFTIPG